MKNGFIHTCIPSLTLLILITFLTFSPCLKADFLNWDDDLHLTKNAAVQTFSRDNILHIFQSSINRTYIPLTLMSFSLEHYVFGLNPFIYHLNNLLLHITVVLIIYFLAIKLGLSSSASFIACLIFAVHPLHVESVAWITERKDVLYSSFYLFAIYQYLIYMRHQNKCSYMISLLAAFFSVLAKPMALSLPWILLLIDWKLDRRRDWSMLLDKIPFLLLIEPIAWITYAQNARAPDIQMPQAILISIWTFSFYLEKFFFPLHLSPLYQAPQPLVLTNPAFLKALSILIVFCTCAWLGRKSRWFIFAVLFYMGSAFFLWRYDLLDASIVADRFMYLPSLGFCLWGGAAFESLLKRHYSRQWIKPAVGIISLLLLLNLSFKSFVQCRTWQDDLTFWNTIIHLNPGSSIAHNNRGEIFSRQEKYREALEDFSRSITLNPANREAFYNKGHALTMLNQGEEAVAYYSQAIALYPQYAGAYQNRGFVYHHLLGQPEKALADFNQALDLNSQNSKVYYSRGLLFQQEKRDYEKALEDFSRAIVIDPEYPDPYFNRGIIYDLKGFHDLAVNDFHTALKLDETLLEMIQPYLEGSGDH